MAADSRYLYHPAHQGLNQSQYNYQYQSPPPTTSYEQSPVQHAPPLPPPPLRNMRTSQPPPHSPQAQYPPQPQPPAQAAGYAPAHSSYSSQSHYMTHSQPAPPQSATAQHTPPPPLQPQQQWSNENWQPQYSQYPSHMSQHHHQQQQQLSSPLPPTVAPENTYNPTPGRPDTSPTLSTSSLRGYDDRTGPMNNHHQPPPPSSIHGVPPTKYRQREEESPSSYTNSQPPSPNLFTGLDYDQLMKQIKVVESPLRETLSTFRSPHPETLEQMMHAATYAAHVLNSAAGITAITTSPAPSGTYQQTNTIPTSQGYNNHRISPPTSRDRMDSNTHSSHNHTLASDNSPPLSASTTGSLKRRHTNEYPENSQQSPSLGGSSSGLPPGPGSQVLTQQPPLPPSSLPQQPGQQQQSFSHPQPPSQLQPGGVAASNLPLVQTEGQTCLGCNATSTPEWRRGPMGPRTLCNACGLVYAKLIKKRDRERARANGNGKNNGSSRPTSGEGHRSGSGGGDSGSGESDEDEPEDDYGSGTSGRRSEFG